MKSLCLVIALLSGFIEEGLSQSPIFRIKGDEMILSLNQNWSKQETDSILRLYDMQALSVDSAFRFGSSGQLAREGWVVRKKGKGIIEVFKPLSETVPSNLSCLPLLVDYAATITEYNGPNAYSDKIFGYNDFKNSSVIELVDGQTQFKLYGHDKAKQVTLSGSFNNWSTQGLPMTRTTDGWAVNIRLPEGRHEYKFTVDGKWIRDNANNLRSDDNLGNYNSVYFKPNYTFELLGYEKSNSVVIAGSFNNWDMNQVHLQKIGDKWILDVFLPNGTYLYKFIADGQWIIDPRNPNTLPDGAGNVNSFLSKGKSSLFRLNDHLDANQVLLSGAFNNWAESGMMMTKTSSGWEIPYVLQPGYYEYKFIVDGKWTIDPSLPTMPNEFGEKNNFIVEQPNHNFELSDYKEAKAVYVTGSFVSWREPGIPMTFTNGKWVLPFYLPQGKNSYKFIVDGKWIRDPGNSTWEDNEFGTGNSVIWIK